MSKAHRDNTIDFLELPARGPAELASAKNFYASVFGWSFQDWGEDYADIKNSGLSGGLNADAQHRPRHPLAIVYATALEATLEKVRAQNGKITREIFSFPGGRRFHFLDPAGNELAVWSDV